MEQAAEPQAEAEPEVKPEAGPEPEAACTPLEGARRVLQHLVQQARAVLGADLVGAYQVGSFALGGADAASDVDFLIVTEHEPDPGQEAGLRRLHAHLPDQPHLPAPWAGHLEGSYAPRGQLRHPPAPPHGRGPGPASGPRPGPGRERERGWLYVDNGQRHLQRSRHDDTLAVRWVAREHGIVLTGPHPTSLIDPVSAQQLRADALQVLAAWDRDLAQRPGQFGTVWAQHQHVLGLCRLLHRSRHGVVSTKTAAGRWALNVLHARWHPLIRAAIDGRGQGWARLHQSLGAGAVQATHAFHEHVVARAGLRLDPPDPLDPLDAAS
ncbi:aminoglycoside adenylyltransferase domain-containing protein [Kineococcus sp. SYSU DK005]|uniref:aminoglycoside adenylyltransferase domain-containing protein n=1 Tax=Kineococcus sp. SYSU DK005 TaxID=3383126 RepID=UPI003D7D4E20